LEPGCGSGHFIGFAEGRGAEMIGVERDPTSARIAQALYPDADIHNVEFQRFDLADPVDAVIGNVPFAEPRAFEPTCARSRRRFTGPGWSRTEPAFRGTPASSICAVCTCGRRAPSEATVHLDTPTHATLVTFRMDVAGTV
jgi:hypothetical protein